MSSAFQSLQPKSNVKLQSRSRRTAPAQYEQSQPPMSPDHILQLQQTIGNQAVQRMLNTQSGTPIQRLKTDEEPIVPGTLSSIHEFVKGKSGKTFKLGNTDGEQIILKFTNKEHDLSKALLGTQSLQMAGTNVPNLKTVSGESLDSILKALEPLEKNPQFANLANRIKGYAGDKDKWDIVVMDFAKGATAEDLKVAEDNSKDHEEGKLSEAVNDPQFQRELGRIIATDAFTGESDRMHMIEVAKGEVNLYFNSGNLMIQKDDGGYHAIPIDNDFQPEKYLGMYGYKNEYGSLLAASRTLFVEEAHLIYKEFAEAIRPPKLEMGKNPLKYGKKLAEYGIKFAKYKIQKAKWEANRNVFTENIVGSAQETMTHLLKRNVGWKDKLKDAGGEDHIERFRLRKRMLRLIQAGIEFNEARSIAKDQTAYHAWVLEHETHLSKPLAQVIAQVGKSDYEYFRDCNWGADSPEDETERRKWELKKLGFGFSAISLLMSDESLYQREVRKTIKYGEPSF